MLSQQESRQQRTEQIKIFSTTKKIKIARREHFFSQYFHIRAFSQDLLL